MEPEGLSGLSEAGQHFNRAHEHDVNDEFEEALHECDAAIEIAPSFADAHNLRGIVLEELGREVEALKAYGQAIALDPKFYEAVDNLLDLERELGISCDLITIATFSHPLDAYVPKTKLEAAGISAFVADDYMITLNWLYSNALGRAKLQVMALEVQRALDILHDTSHEVELSEDEQPRCPACGSFRTRYQKYDLRVAFAAWLLLGFPIPFPKRKWRCSDCHYEWKLESREF